MMCLISLAMLVHHDQTKGRCEVITDPRGDRPASSVRDLVLVTSCSRSFKMTSSSNMQTALRHLDGLFPLHVLAVSGLKFLAWRPGRDTVVAHTRRLVAVALR